MSEHAKPDPGRSGLPVLLNACALLVTLAGIAVSSALRELAETVRTTRQES